MRDYPTKSLGTKCLVPTTDCSSSAIYVDNYLSPDSEEEVIKETIPMTHPLLLNETNGNFIVK